MRGKTILSNLFFITLLTSLVPCQERPKPQSAPSSVDIDIPALLRESTRKSSVNWGLRRKHISDFTYKFRWIQRRKDKPEDSELIELYFPDTKREYKHVRAVHVLLEKNGKPTPPEQIEEARRKAGEKLDKRENVGVQQTETDPAPAQWMMSKTNLGVGKSATVDVSEIMATCDFHSPRRTRIGEREAIVLDFRPRPDAKFSERTKYMSQVEGSLWIDVQDQVVIRCAGWSKSTKPVNSERDETLDTAAFCYELVKVKEGIWLERREHLNGTKYPELFSSIKNIECIAEYLDYQYFGVGIEKEIIKAPIQKPPQ